MFSHHHDIRTKLTCTDGSIVHALDFTDKELCASKSIWSLGHDGNIVNNKIISASKTRSIHLGDIVVNDGEIIVPFYKDNKFYDQHGVIYNHNELKVNMYLGGISSRTLTNMRYGDHGYIHHCTGVFKITKITRNEKECDTLELLLDNHCFNVANSKGIFLRTNNPFG